MRFTEPVCSKFPRRRKQLTNDVAVPYRKPQRITACVLCIERTTQTRLDFPTWGGVWTTKPRWRRAFHARKNALSPEIHQKVSWVVSLGKACNRGKGATSSDTWYTQHLDQGPTTRARTWQHTGAACKHSRKTINNVL